jgi:hypothetical protein
MLEGPLTVSAVGPLKTLPKLPAIRAAFGG